MGMKPCPRCNQQTASLIKIETGMRLGLSAASMAEGLPDQVCPNCYQELAQHVSEGARLRAEIKAKDANRQNMWATRVALIKAGRDLMAQKNFSEAAVAYEKYLRIVEICHDQNPGEISPEPFKNSSKNKELTVITSVYWDLLRIYDSHARYVDRQVMAAKKLAEFSRHTPIYGDIAKRVIDFKKNAKNKEPFEIFLRTANIRASRCFIATATFETRDCFEVEELCRFRDEVLMENGLGISFIQFYYSHSPKVAEFIDRHPATRIPLRPVLRLTAKIASKITRR